MMQNNLFRIIIYLFILNIVSVMYYNFMYYNFRVKFRQLNMGYWFKLKYDINMSILYEYIF